MKTLATILVLTFVGLVVSLSGCALPVRMVPSDCEGCVTLSPEQLRAMAAKLYDKGYDSGYKAATKIDRDRT
ncbi:MAG: hypothetical protein ACSLE9_06670 [Burkholderiaceae bacterium]